MSSPYILGNWFEFISKFLTSQFIILLLFNFIDIISQIQR